MKIKLLGKNLDDIRPLFPRFGLEEVENGAETVIAYGGDGTLLSAEREYPQLPKLAIRDAATAPTCPVHEAAQVLERFVSGALEKSFLPKLSAVCRDGKLLAVNDLFLHNLDRSTALRYRVHIDGELYASEVRGDGVCMSSVHGSTAYYRCPFRKVEKNFQKSGDQLFPGCKNFSSGSYSRKSDESARGKDKKYSAFKCQTGGKFFCF